MEGRSPVPRLLAEVLQALYDLGETGNVTLAKIVEHVKESTKSGNNTPAPRNISAQIQRALTTAVNCKMVQQRAGRYNINTGQQSPSDCAACRRRQRNSKRRKGGRRRGRSRHATFEPSDSEADSATDCSEEDSRSVSRSRSKSRSERAASPKSETTAFVVARRRRRKGTGKSTRRKRRRSRSKH